MNLRVRISKPAAKDKATRQEIAVSVDGVDTVQPQEIPIDQATYRIEGVEEGSLVEFRHRFADRAGNWSAVTVSKFNLEDLTAPAAPPSSDFEIEEDVPVEPPDSTLTAA